MSEVLDRLETLARLAGKAAAGKHKGPAAAKSHRRTQMSDEEFEAEERREKAFERLRGNYGGAAKRGSNIPLDNLIPRGGAKGGYRIKDFKKRASSAQYLSQEDGDLFAKEEITRYIKEGVLPKTVLDENGNLKDLDPSNFEAKNAVSKKDAQLIKDLIEEGDLPKSIVNFKGFNVGIKGTPQMTKPVAKPVTNPIKSDANKKKMKDKISALIEDYEKKYGRFVRNY